uniref:Uncharacterized protein n=1 Tax=Aegilops tauschii subsp. strangulata TaxID=200361 RepID=A0A452Y8K3_AEGTS
MAAPPLSAARQRRHTPRLSWQSERQNTPKPMHKGLASTALLVPWLICKHRNGCVFEGARPPVTSLIASIKARAGALGLRVILPRTWDVH